MTTTLTMAMAMTMTMATMCLRLAHGTAMPAGISAWLFSWVSS